MCTLDSQSDDLSGPWRHTPRPIQRARQNSPLGARKPHFIPTSRRILLLESLDWTHFEYYCDQHHGVHHRHLLLAPWLSARGRRGCRILKHLQDSEQSEAVPPVLVVGAVISIAVFVVVDSRKNHAPVEPTTFLRVIQLLTFIFIYGVDFQSEED